MQAEQGLFFPAWHMSAAACATRTRSHATGVQNEADMTGLRCVYFCKHCVRDGLEMIFFIGEAHVCGQPSLSSLALREACGTIAVRLAASPCLWL